MKRVGIVFHPRLETAKAVVSQLSQVLPSLNVSFWLSSAWEEEKVKAQVPDTELLISVGGDGTILRAARAIAPWEVPILGINLGKLGFMTELSPGEVLDKLPAILSGEGWIDQRTMIQVELSPLSSPGSRLFHALNDAVVGRGAVCRVIHIRTSIDGELLTTYKADGLIVSTATGSTGYSLAAGGPILYPQAPEILLQPVCAHLTLSYPIVLPPAAAVELEVKTEHQAVLSIDGQVELPLGSGDKVKARRSPYKARFLRIHPASSFYRLLGQKLIGVPSGESGKGKNQ